MKKLALMVLFAVVSTGAHAHGGFYVYPPYAPPQYYPPQYYQPYYPPYYRPYIPPPYYQPPIYYPPYRVYPPIYGWHHGGGGWRGEHGGGRHGR
jgi:hypothetical protein